VSFLLTRRFTSPVWRNTLAWFKACNLFVLDKGKPVVRPGRKAKGHTGSLVWKPGCRRDGGRRSAFGGAAAGNLLDAGIGGFGRLFLRPDEGSAHAVLSLFNGLLDGRRT
jgi:hypothetical protein